MSNEVRLNALRETALELQEICKFNPPFHSKGKTEEQVVDWLKEAAPLLELNDVAEISADTKDILEQLGFWKFEDSNEIEDAEEVEEEEETVADNLDIIAEIETAPSVRELKDVARTYAEFKSIRGNLSSYKKAEDLRECMIGILNPGAEKPEKEVKLKVKSKAKSEPSPKEKKPEEEKLAEKKKPEPKTEKKKESSPSKRTKKAVVEEMINSKTGATIEEIAQKITDEKIDLDYSKNYVVAKLWLSKMRFDVKKAAIAKNPKFKK